MASAPPPVWYAVGRTPALACLLLGVWLMGVLASGVWFVLSWDESPGLPELVSLALLFFSAWALGHFWRSQMPRHLGWDGAQWLLQGPPGQKAVAVVLQPRLDLQLALLLHSEDGLKNQRVPRWLWVQRGPDAAGWHLLRCALYFSALDGAAAPA